MTSIKSNDQQAVAAPTRAIERISVKVRTRIAETLVNANAMDAFFALGKTSKVWRDATHNAHPLLRDTYQANDPDKAGHWALHRALARIIPIASVPLFARFLLDVEAADEATLKKVLNSCSADALTPIMLSARLGLAGITETLLKAGANADAKDPASRNAVLWAFEGKHKRLAKRLLGRVATTTKEKYFFQLLREKDLKPISFDRSVAVGHVTIAREHLAQGGVTVTRDHLIAAAKTIYAMPMASLLLNHEPTLASDAHEATLEAIKTMGNPVYWLELMMAQPHHNLERGALLHATAKAGKYAAFKCVFDGARDDVNQYDSEGKSFFYYAAAQGNLEFANDMLSRGAKHDSPANAPLLPAVVGEISLYYDQPTGAGWDTVLIETPSPAHYEMAKRLLEPDLSWPKAHLDAALTGARGMIKDLRGEYGTEPSIVSLKEVIALLEARGASLPSPPESKKFGFFKRRSQK